jgi:hypothetical protein
MRLVLLPATDTGSGLLTDILYTTSYCPAEGTVIGKLKSCSKQRNSGRVVTCEQALQVVSTKSLWTSGFTEQCVKEQRCRCKQHGAMCWCAQEARDLVARN